PAEQLSAINPTTAKGGTPFPFCLTQLGNVDFKGGSSGGLAIKISYFVRHIPRPACQRVCEVVCDGVWEHIFPMPRAKTLRVETTPRVKVIYRGDRRGRHRPRKRCLRR